MSSFFWIRLWLETASGSVLFRERGNHEHRWEGNIRSLSMKLLEKAAESEGLQRDTGYDEFADMVTVDHDADVCWVLMQRNGREAADLEYESLLERRHGTWIGFTNRQKGHRIKTGVQSQASQWRTSGEIPVQTRHHGYSQLYDADYDEATRGTLLSFAIQNNLQWNGIAKNPAGHSRTKHGDIRQHYIRVCVQNGWIELKDSPTNELKADIVTKPLTKQKLEYLRRETGLFPMSFCLIGAVKKKVSRLS